MRAICVSIFTRNKREPLLVVAVVVERKAGVGGAQTPCAVARYDREKNVETAANALNGRMGVGFQPANVVAEAPVLQDRLARAKRSFVCRHVDLSLAAGLSRTVEPQTGYVLLATVIELGHHARLESPEGRRAQLYPGDEILVAYGARYAPDQFEAVLPDSVGPCDLVAGGGIAARVLARHASVKKATTISPLGVLTDRSGAALELRHFVLPARAVGASAPHQIIAVVGTSMNAGKTTAAASLIRGLAAGGLKVGACKITGTGSGGDIWSMRDAGAAVALDFTDVGYSTTAGAELGELEAAAHLLIDRVVAAGVDVVVVEIADGLLQRETAALLSSPRTAQRLDAVLLAAADSMGAVMGSSWLRERGLPLRAVTGLLTSSPLATREAQQQVNVEVVPTRALLNSTEAARLCHHTPFVPLGVVS